MSGSLEVQGVISDWEGVEGYLYGEEEEDNDSGDWNDDDDRDKDDKGSSSVTSPKGSTKGSTWVQDCVIGVSPIGDVLVIARDKKAVFLTSQWDSKEGRFKYSTLHQNSFSQDGEEIITSVLCIPLISSKKSSPGGVPDWTCIVLGFSNGYTRFYTDNGVLLLSQMFHDQSVSGLKAKSFRPGGGVHGHDQLEELFILYKTVLVTIDGFGLFQTLRGCRSRIARHQGTGGASGEVLEPPPLSYKKWEYDEKQRVSDCESIGVRTPGMFDHLLAASVLGGPQARVNKVPWTSTVFAAVGEKPYLSFHHAREDQQPFVISKLAYAVANKVTSSLFSAATGWFGMGKSQNPKEDNKLKEPPKIEPPTRMSARFGLPDRERRGRSINLSPCGRLSAVADSLGRVILIDNSLGVGVRMWKGYRDAQCAWIQVEDDMKQRTSIRSGGRSGSSGSGSTTSGRKALFLVIYAPRKGQIEVFAMQQGPKVATFQVSKNGRLISIPYGMMGLNNISLKGLDQGGVLPCLFLDPDGSFHQFHIPFHLALSDTSNTKLKDMHLLKTLQRTLRDSPTPSSLDPSDLNKLLWEVKTQPMINQGFKILLQYGKDFDLLLNVVESYLEKFCEDEGRDLSIPFRIQSLLHLYSYLRRGMEAPPAYEGGGPSSSSSSSSNDTVLLCLHASDKEIKLVKDMANKEIFNKKGKVKGTSGPSVSFADEKKEPRGVGVSDLLSVFEIEWDPLKISRASSTSSAGNDSKLTINVKSENIQKLDLALFLGAFNQATVISDLQEWKTLVKNCSLIPTQLITEVLKFWSSNALAGTSSFVEMMGKLYLILRAICELEGVSEEEETSSSSPWWDRIRKEIASGTKTFYNYTFALVCRAVAIDITQEKRKNEDIVKAKNKEADRSNPDLEGSEGGLKESSGANEDLLEDNLSLEDVDEEGWENVSLDLIRWNILLKQLEDLSFLTTILGQEPPLKDPPLPKLKPSFDLLSGGVSGGELSLSVVSLLDKGSGCIAELVGHWLTTIGVDPLEIVESSELPRKALNEMPHLSPEYTDKELKEKEKEHPNDEISSKASAELEEENKVLSKSSEVNYIKELVRCLKENFPVSLNSSIILSNYCWEYCLSWWNGDVENVGLLKAAVACASAVPDNRIKQGLMSMMWQTFISKQLASLVGKGSGSAKLRMKDKLVEKITLISHPDNRTAFLTSCVKFLDEFMNCSVTSMQSGEDFRRVDKSSKKKNNLWSGSSTASLTEMALNQPSPNYEMILLHYQLALVGLFVSNFGIRKASMKPVNLFDTTACMMFFTPINNQGAPYSYSEVDLALKILREEFLCLVVSNIIGKIPEDDEAEEDNHVIAPSPSGLKESEDWIQKCFELGRIWGLDLDSLRINQVCEFYLAGFDFLGLESIGAVTAKDILGSKLLVIAGMRLHYYIEGNRGEKTTEIVSSMSTNLSNWLNKLDYSKLRCLRFPKSSIKDLVQQVIHLIPDSSYDYRLSEDLLVCLSFL